MNHNAQEFLKQLHATNAETNGRKYHKLARRTGLMESYAASWHGRGIFQARLNVRVERYPDRCEVTGANLEQSEKDLDWKPVKVKRRLLTEDEWQTIIEWVSAAGFWELPTSDNAASCMDGEVWTIEGFRDGRYHEVRRLTGSVIDGTGEEVFRFGQRLARLAGLRDADDGM